MMDWIEATAKSGTDPRDLPEDIHACLKGVFRLGIVEGLDAASRYMNDQYGVGALDNPIDRARIISDPPHAEGR